jgi:hypothetical protein
MAELVADCPRCGANKITFDVEGKNRFATHGWQTSWEVFGLCRQCGRTTIFILSQRDPQTNVLDNEAEGFSLFGALNNYYEMRGFVSMKDIQHAQPPDHLPEDIKSVFSEGATCLSVECFNAAGTMFRLCVDIATRSRLPAQNENGLNAEIRRNLGRRIRWLLDNGRLPDALRELSTCIREDGNDGAHAGSLTQEEADDLLDFTTLLLERLYTEPERLRLAEERRKARRDTAQAAGAGTTAAPGARN